MAANLFYSYIIQPWSRATVWDNPITGLPGYVMKSLPLDRATLAVNAIANSSFVKPVWNNTPVKVIAAPIRLIAHFTYDTAERILNSTAVLRALSDMDSLGKTVMFVTGLAILILGPKHPFAAHLMLGNKAIGGFIFAKHFVTLVDFTKNYTNKVWNKDGNFIPFGATQDGKGGWKLSEYCKTAALVNFQFSHLCQTYDYVKRIGFFNLLSQVSFVSYVAKGCLNLELGPKKSPAVVIGAIFATLAVGEWAYGQFDKARKGDIKGHTRAEESSQTENAINNITKGLVVAAQAKWIKMNQLYLDIAANVLGATNLSKGAGYVQKEGRDADDVLDQFVRLYLDPDTYSGQIVVETHVGDKEILKQRRFIRVA